MPVSTAFLLCSYYCQTMKWLREWTQKTEGFVLNMTVSLVRCLWPSSLVDILSTYLMGLLEHYENPTYGSQTDSTLIKHGIIRTVKQGKTRRILSVKMTRSKPSIFLPYEKGKEGSRWGRIALRMSSGFSLILWGMFSG